MAFISYPLNNTDYTAEDAQLFHATRGSGVYSGDDFRCTVTGADNFVSVGPGIGWMHLSRFAGIVFAEKQDTVLDLGLPHPSLGRKDAITIRFSLDKNTTELVVKQGTPSSDPQIPTIERNEALFELYVAVVDRRVGVTAISAGDVTDTRLDPQWCGLMADAVTSIDTAGIDAQVQSLIERLQRGIDDVESGTILDGLIGTYTCVKKGARFELSGLGDNIKFIAPADYTDGDTFVLNGNVVEARTTSGDAISGGFFVKNAVVVCYANGGILNFSAGGTALNLKVVGGATQPASPAENTIWVATSEAIAGWEISATEPSSPSAGQVWIRGGTQSGAAFNALKDNVLMVYPAGAAQYIGGAWERKGAQVYVNGVWRNTEALLYDDGMVVPFESFRDTPDARIQATLRDDGTDLYALVIYQGANAGFLSGSAGWRTQDLIDVSGYTTATVDIAPAVNWTSYNGVRLEFWDGAGNSVKTVTIFENKQGAAVRNVYTLDISSVRGVYKVGVTAWQTYSEGRAASFLLYKLVLT